MKKRASCVMKAIGGILLLCVGLSLVSALSNLTLPQGPERLDRLDPLDKARLVESLHFKQTLGESVWPGWGQTDIPVLLWNHESSFLTGFDAAPPGWEIVPDDDLDGVPYYRQPTHHPQNFAVRVGNRWVASMATKWETDAFMRGVFRDFLPPGLAQIFPYRILIMPSEVQMTGVLHETFHVYQTLVAPDRLEAAEAAHRLGDRYWEADAAMRADWQQEIALLREAVQTDSDAEARELARQFLAQRQQRRDAHALTPDLVEYERWLEWEEGLAKYVELESWRQASLAPDYEPLAGMVADADFKGYATFRQRFSQEISQMQRQATQEGEPRFYYTGLAQAMLLDRLAPGWKAQIFAEGVWLEDLLSSN